jgi:hypothetical protein
VKVPLTRSEHRVCSRSMKRPIARRNTRQCARSKKRWMGRAAASTRAMMTPALIPPATGSTGASLARRRKSKRCKRRGDVQEWRQQEPRHSPLPPRTGSVGDLRRWRRSGRRLTLWRLASQAITNKRRMSMRMRSPTSDLHRAERPWRGRGGRGETPTWTCERAWCPCRPQNAKGSRRALEKGREATAAAEEGGAAEEEGGRKRRAVCSSFSACRLEARQSMCTLLLSFSPGSYTQMILTHERC